MMIDTMNETNQEHAHTFQMEVKNPCELTKITALFTPLESFADTLRIFLHGSWADASTTAFSDIDDFVILDDTKLSVTERRHIYEILHHVDLEFSKIDPLQHHGHWLVESSQLEDYNNAYMPLFIMKDAKHILGDRKVTANISPRKTRDGLIGSIRNTCKNIERFLKKHLKNYLNLYELKCFVGSFALLPPLIFQLRQNSYDKKTALARASEIYSEESMTLLTWATELRNNWGRLLENSEYKAFAQKIHAFSDVNAWRTFARQNAPILSYKHLSTTQLTAERVYSFIQESLEYIDEACLIKKTAEDYILGYEELEKFAISQNALVVGQFGTVNEPSISDLDVLICFPDACCKPAIENTEKYISRNANLSYLLPHPPVYISESMLPTTPYLHTLYDLTITYNPHNISLQSLRKKNYVRLLELLWIFYLIPLCEEIIQEISYYDVRFLLLVLKNIQYSLCNLSGEASHFKTSKALRQQVIQGASCSIHRKAVEQAILTDYHTLLDTMDAYQVRPSKDRFYVVNRWLIFKESTRNQYMQKGKEVYYELTPYFFEMAKRLFFRHRHNEQATYVKYLRTVKHTSKALEIAFPFVLPFEYLLEEPETIKRSIKVGCYFTASFFPYSWVQSLVHLNKE